MKPMTHVCLALACALMMCSAPAVAQQGEGAAAPDDRAANAPSGPQAAEQPEADASEGPKAAKPKADDADDADTDGESAHGTYEWKPSWGAGLELGYFFTELERWNTYLIEPSDAELIDTIGIFNFDAAVEAAFIENTRLTLFGGYASPLTDEPSIGALYIGLEPAFTFRRDMWEMALGMGAGLGSVEVTYGDDNGASERELDAGVVLLRPFLEVRRYLNEWAAVYGRVGFETWLPFEPETEGLTFRQLDGDPEDEEALDEGGPRLAIGVRFGSYPKHVKIVADTDGDTYRDDVDDCPEEAEDFDEFQDEDGCPDLDNDADTVPDATDECPNEAEDIDAWQDEDGCPETDDDTDGDGVLNQNDKCPEQPEDKDGFEDADGCPDPDNDQDGIADAEDDCPDKRGVPQKQGCAFERVVVTMEKIEIKDKIFFEYNKAAIKPESFELLDEIAATLKANPQIKKIEIQGHTDLKASEKYNQELSEKRAAAVQAYLVDKGGVSAERLTAKGYGESQPLVTPEGGKKETDEQAAKNRRVEFIILEQEEVKRVVPENQIPEGAADVEETGEAAEEATDEALEAPAAAPGDEADEADEE